MTAPAEEPRSVLAMAVADRMLAEVANVDDAKELINMAEMARVYARQSKLGTSAINHATVIKIRAERKLADMVDAGQARGEIAERGRDNQNTANPQTGVATLAEIDIQPQRLAEARNEAEARSAVGAIAWTLAAQGL